MRTRTLAALLALAVAGPALSAQDAKTESQPKAPQSGPQPAAEKPAPYDPFSLSFPLADAPDAERVYLKFFGEQRTRYEGRTPSTFAPGLARHTATSLVNLRTRLGIEVRFPRNVNALFEIQDSRLWGDEPRADANAVNTSALTGTDVLQANMFTTNLLNAGIEARLGRQKFTIGNQRLWSTLEWSVQSRAWDGLRLQRGFGTDFHLQAFAVLVNELSRLKDDEWVFGASLRWTPAFAPRHELELLVLYDFRDDEANSSQFAEVATVSLRYNGFIGLNADDSLALEFTAEGAFQFGEADPGFWGAPGRSDSAVQAFGSALTLDWLFAVSDHKFRVGLEYGFASGDSNPGDARLQTFRAPFPFAHKYQGWADQVGWRNLHDLVLRASWSHAMDGEVESIGVLIELHAFQRANDDDAWYAPNGTVIRAGSPAQSDELGYEFDLQIPLKVSRFFTFEAGWAHFFSGRFVSQTASGSGPGSNNEDSDLDFFWLQAAVRF